MKQEEEATRRKDLKKVTAWAWRGALLIYLISTMLRLSAVGDALPSATWQLLQFGTIPLVIVLSIFSRPWAGRLDRPQTVFYVSLGAFILVAMASVVVSVDRSHSAFQWAITVLMTLFVASNAMLRWKDQPSAVRSDLTLVVVFFALAQALGYVLWFVDRDLAVGDYGRFIGLFNNPNYTGMVSAVALVMLLGLILTTQSPRAKTAFAALSLPVLASLAMSGSRGSAIACIVGLAIVVISFTERRPVRFLTTAVAVVLAAAVLLVPAQEIRDNLANLPPSPAPSVIASEAPSVTVPAPAVTESPEVAVDRWSSGRLELYKDAVDAWLDVPVLGTGFRSTPSVIGGMETHNLFLQALLETGILGAAAFCGMLAAVYLKIRSGSANLILLAAVVTIAILELSESSMFGWGGPTALFFWITVFGFLYAPRWTPGLAQVENPSMHVLASK